MHYRLSFSGQIYESQSKAFQDRIAAIQLQSNYESLTVLFSSDGGNPYYGFALYNYIRSLPKPIRMHGIGHIGSAAVAVFLAGHTRTCTPTSRFLFHPFSWGFNGNPLVDQIAAALQQLDSDIALSRDIAGRHTSMQAAEIDALYGRSVQTTILTPDEAKQRGIVQDVLELNPSGTHEPNVAMWSVLW